MSLNETVEYMRENSVQLQLTFEILDKMYDELDLNISYSETTEVV